jgi:membrane protease YdiL (CAAX protease family)
MLRTLQILNAVLLALGVTFTVTLAVVALLLGVYVDEYPRYRQTLDGTLLVTLLALLMAGAGALCFQSLRRRWPLWPALQGLGWGMAAVVVMVGMQMLGAPQ